MVTPLPNHLRLPLRALIAGGGSVARHGSGILIDGPPSLTSALHAHIDELTQHVVPSVGAEQAGLIRELLADAGAAVAYITAPDAAREAVAKIVAGAPDVVGLDFETAVLPEFRQPIPIRFCKDGNLAARQPRDGAGGVALDPYRSRVRLVQAWAGGEHVYVFDMKALTWADIASLFALPLAIFNAVFEVKRLIHEAKIEPTGRIYDVMTACWLTDGRRPSVAELISDWFGADSILRQSFAAGIDAHTATAMSMTGKTSPQDVTADERQLAKPCNFGLLYRMGNQGFYNYLRVNFVPNITFEQACELKAQFFAGYPDMARWQDEYARRAREQGYTQTVAGRRWRWKWRAQNPDDVDEDTPFYGDAIIGFRGAYAVNHPVQGSSAEVMQIALTRLDQALRDEPVQIIATVHDEVVLLVPDDVATIERIGAIAEQEMIAAFVEVFPDAPTLNLVDSKVGPTWGDLQPLPAFIEERKKYLVAV
jgi:hypothetical protein